MWASRRRLRHPSACDRGAALALSGTLLAAWAVFPAPASAHGIVGRTDLPIPEWMFAWAAAFALIASFVALAILWPKPRLQQHKTRRLLAFPAWLEPLAGAIGVALFAIVTYSGIAGAQVPTANLAPTFVFALFWVGFPVASVLFGDVFRPVNPWRATARAIGWALRRVSGGRARPPLRYPDWLGVWPAVATLIGFAWLELVYVDRDYPKTLVLIACSYAGFQLIGMAAFGVERWIERADGFSVYFRLMSRLSIVEVHERTVFRRPPLSGLPGLELLPGTVALLCTIIGTTTFDGASNGVLWINTAPSLIEFFNHLGFSVEVANELAGSVGLMVCVLAVVCFYWLGIWGIRSVSDQFEVEDLARRFAHTLAPIAFAYILAHYFSLLVYQGQAVGYLISDPLGNGSDYFGTSGFQIDYAIVTATAIWYVQVVALIAGHVSGLTLAHDRALAMYRNPREAVRSQYWMLVIMVGFTCLGLWLLSAVAV